MGNLNCSRQETDNEEYTENFSEYDNSKAAIVIQKQFRRMHTSVQIPELILSKVKSEYAQKNIYVEEISSKEFNDHINQQVSSTLAALNNFDLTIDSEASNTNNNNNNSNSNSSALIYELKCLKFSNKTTNQIEYYHGQWNCSGNRHGIGILITSENTLYYGNFHNGIKKGRGVLIQNNGDYYQGYFNNDIANGKGILNIAAEYVYNGGWKDNCKDGMGIEIYKDGSKYEGHFINNERQGQGKYYYSDGSYYEGEFSQSQFEGNGKLIWKDGRKYIGEFSKGKIEGKGVFTWPNGSKYKGEYNNQMKEGKGEFEWKDGQTLTGFWFKNKPHGKLYIHNKNESDNKMVGSYSMMFRYGKLIHSNNPIPNSKSHRNKHADIDDYYSPSRPL